MISGICSYGFHIHFHLGERAKVSRGDDRRIDSLKETRGRDARVMQCGLMARGSSFVLGA